METSTARVAGGGAGAKSPTDAAAEEKRRHAKRMRELETKSIVEIHDCFFSNWVDQENLTIEEKAEDINEVERMIVEIEKLVDYNKRKEEEEKEEEVAKEEKKAVDDEDFEKDHYLQISYHPYQGYDPKQKRMPARMKRVRLEILENINYHLLPEKTKKIFVDSYQGGANIYCKDNKWFRDVWKNLYWGEEMEKWGIADGVRERNFNSK
jgi:hypothetical protein